MMIGFKAALLGGTTAVTLLASPVGAQTTSTVAPSSSSPTSAEPSASQPGVPDTTSSTIAGQDGNGADAYAQSQSEEASSDIVVTGIRESLRSAAQQKRSAANVIDAITSEDIGKFPTENVADASQRITGVQITRTRGSGTAASIRGLPPAFTRVQLNGSTLSSALVDLNGGGGGGDITRTFDFRTLPTEFVRTLEVAKSPTADMQEGGLSGTINVKTVRPFDVAKTTYTLSAFGLRNSNSGKVTPRISGLASTQLFDGRLGILVAGGYDEARTETHNVGLDGFNTQREAATRVDYNNDGDLLDTFNIPSQVRTEIFREQRKRFTLSSILEFRASDGVKLYAEGFMSKFDIKVDDYQNLNIYSSASGGVFDPSTTVFTEIPGIDPAQLTAGHPFATTIGLSGTDVRGLNRINNTKALTYYTKGGVDIDVNGWTGGASFTYSNSHQRGDNLGLAQIARFDVTSACVPGQQICGIGLTPSSQQRYLDPNQPIVASLNGAFGRDISDRISEAKVDLAREFDSPLINKIMVGGLASWRKTYSTGPTLVVPAAALARIAGLQRSTVNPAGFSAQPFELIVTPGSGDFLGHYSGDLTFPTSWVSSDTGKLLSQVSRAQLLSAGMLNANQSAIVDLKEDIVAGYVRVDFGQRNEPLTGNIGLRVVRTAATSTGFAPDFSGIRILTDAGGTVATQAAGEIAAKNTYTEFLPSANVKYDVSPNFLLRFAASRTMSRPTLTQISPSTTIAGVGNNFTITRGNPNLKPFLSWNLDAGAEWYPNADTSLTVAVFYKDLSTLVRPITTNVTYPVTFVTTATGATVVRDQLFQQTQPSNQNGVTLKGLEAGYQQVFSFLPGLLSHTGFQANYTFISNSDPQVLTAASKNNFNLSAFYENAGLALRASYTWRDKFVSTGLPDGFYGLGVTTRPRGALDVNVTWDVTPHVSLIMEGTNVLNNADATRTTLGNIPVAFFDVGNQVMLGARVKF